MEYSRDEIEELAKVMCSEDTLFLDPEELDEAIIGTFTEYEHCDRLHVVYSRCKLIEAWNRIHRKAFNNLSDDEILGMTLDVVDGDMLRSLQYMQTDKKNYVPIVVDD